MNVKIATETLSNAVANSFKYLLDKRVPKFQNVGATIRFVEIFNNLFDIFNSRATNSFQSTRYIKNLKVMNKKNRKIPIVESRNGISFRGYIINMAALKQIFEELVEEKMYVDSISTYLMSQDFLEIFFGKMRSFHGFNNNPDVICFQSAYKKLCSDIQVQPPLKSNSQQLHTRLSIIASHSNIFKVSSLRPKLYTNTSVKPNSEFMKNVRKEKKQIASAICQLEEMNKNYYLTDGFAGASIAYVAQLIEEKIKKNFFCKDCKSIFDDDDPNVLLK